jgi:hypothetical protein
VSADNVPQLKNRRVERLQDFGQDIKTRHNREIPPSRIARREQKRDQQKQDGVQLHGGVKAQIARAA